MKGTVAIGDKRLAGARGAAASSARTPRAFEPWLAVALLVLAPILAFAPVCRHDFSSWDDGYQVRDNPSYNPVTAHSPVIWWTKPRMDLYMPVTYSIWGLIALEAYHPATGPTPAHLDPTPFHTFNLVVHVSCGLMVFVLLRMLLAAGSSPSPGTPGEGRGGGERATAGSGLQTPSPPCRNQMQTRGGNNQAGNPLWPAVVGALLFSLHPVQAEPVAWISGVNTPLCALLAFAAIWQYLLAVQGRKIRAGAPARRDDSGLEPQATRPSRWHYAAAILLYVLAMLAKPAAVIAPLIAGILDVLIIGRSWRSALGWLWPWFVLAAACGLETVCFQHESVEPRNVAIYLRPLVAIDSLGFYLSKIVWPRNLTFDYGLRPSILIHDPWLIVNCLLLAGIAVGLYRLRYSARPVVAGALVFLAPLLPVLGVITYAFQWYSNVADHYLYMPMLGLAIAAAWICRRWNRWPMYAGAAGVLALLGVLSYQQTKYWQNGRTLILHEMDAAPESDSGYRMLADMALDENNYPAALELSEEAMKHRPDNLVNHFDRAAALWHLNQQQEAVIEYRRAIELNQPDIPTLQGLVKQFSQPGYWDQAEYVCRLIVQTEPSSAEDHCKLAEVEVQEGKSADALAEFQRALGLDPHLQAALDGRDKLVGAVHK